MVVPLVVISELEAKRHHHELGWFARQALRLFDDLRLEHGRLDQPIPVGTQGGTLQVELNHSDPTVLPLGFRTDTNDARILTCAANLAAEGKRVTLVSKDIPLRVKAGAVGLAADEYHAQDVITSGWTGKRNLKMISWWFSTDGVSLGEHGLVEDCFFKVNDDALKLYHGDTTVRRCVIWQMENGAPFQISCTPISMVVWMLRCSLSHAARTESTSPTTTRSASQVSSARPRACTSDAMATGAVASRHATATTSRTMAGRLGMAEG